MIQAIDLAIQAGAFRLEGIDFDVPAGSYCVLMGRTGCGKSTLLETICGLKPPKSGRVLLCGRDVTLAKPAARGIGFVPQDGALFSSMTVREHLEFALRIRRWPTAEIRRRVEELAETIGLSHLLPRKPHGLSGGERQRVSLGRAISFRPRILCLDEPLSALDDDSRHELIDLLKCVQRASGMTALHVTHHRGEAELLADLRLCIVDRQLHVLNRDEFPLDTALGLDQASSPALKNRR